MISPTEQSLTQHPLCVCVYTFLLSIICCCCCLSGQFMVILRRQITQKWAFCHFSSPSSLCLLCCSSHISFAFLHNQTTCVVNVICHITLLSNLRCCINSWYFNGCMQWNERFEMIKRGNYDFMKWLRFYTINYLYKWYKPCTLELDSPDPILYGKCWSVHFSKYLLFFVFHRRKKKKKEIMQGWNSIFIFCEPSFVTVSPDPKNFILHFGL